MAVDITRFRAAMARFPGAVTIVTACTPEGAWRGITATAVCSVSAEPPSLLVCLNRKTGTCAAVRETGRFNVNLLTEGAAEVALRFAGAGGVTGAAKFEGGGWLADARGLPLLPGAVAQFCCEVAEVTDAGSHSVFIGQIVDLMSAEAPALVYEQARFHRLLPL